MRSEFNDRSHHRDHTSQAHQLQQVLAHPGHPRSGDERDEQRDAPADDHTKVGQPGTDRSEETASAAPALLLGDRKLTLERSFFGRGLGFFEHHISDAEADHPAHGVTIGGLGLPDQSVHTVVERERRLDQPRASVVHGFVDQLGALGVKQPGLGGVQPDGIGEEELDFGHRTDHRLPVGRGRTLESGVGPGTRCGRYRSDQEGHEQCPQRGGAGQGPQGKHPRTVMAVRNGGLASRSAHGHGREGLTHCSGQGEQPHSPAASRGDLALRCHHREGNGIGSIADRLRRYPAGGWCSCAPGGQGAQADAYLAGACQPGQPAGFLCLFVAETQRLSKPGGVRDHSRTDHDAGDAEGGDDGIGNRSHISTVTAIGLSHQPSVPGAPLKGPVTLLVIQPP